MFLRIFGIDISDRRNLALLACWHGKRYTYSRMKALFFRTIRSFTMAIAISSFLMVVSLACIACSFCTEDAAYEASICGCLFLFVATIFTSFAILASDACESTL